MFTPVIDVINLEREDIVWTDAITTPNVTYIGKIAAGLTPVTTRTAEKSWHIYIIRANGQMEKPIDPATGQYFSETKPQAWDDKTTLTYG